MNNNSNTLSDSSLTTKQKLSFLWIFAIANYIFCDFSTLLYPESLTFQWRSTGVYWKDHMEVNPSRILSFAIVMQLPIMMIPLSVFLPYKSNRIANITRATDDYYYRSNDDYFSWIDPVWRTVFHLHI